MAVTRLALILVCTVSVLALDFSFHFIFLSVSFHCQILEIHGTVEDWAVPGTRQELTEVTQQFDELDLIDDLWRIEKNEKSCNTIFSK